MDKFHPEINTTKLVNPKQGNDYQKLMGMSQWLNSIGQVDIVFATNQWSKFNAAPCEGHIKYVEQMYGFLKK